MAGDVVDLEQGILGAGEDEQAASYRAFWEKTHEDPTGTPLHRQMGLRIVRLQPKTVLSMELSGREVEVLRLVADGQSNKQIGDELGLSALTVKSHLARIARKLGTGDRAEMVALAMRAGVIR